jgi:hypothetical protein
VDCGIDDLAAAMRQLYAHTAPIVGVRVALHEALDL